MVLFSDKSPKKNAQHFICEKFQNSLDNLSEIPPFVGNRTEFMCCLV